MKILTLLLLLLPNFMGGYTPFKINIFPGASGNRGGYYVKISSDRDEFIARKKGNKMFSVLEYRIILFKGKHFLNGNIYIDTFSTDSGNFVKTLFYPSDSDSVNMEVDIVDRLSGKIYKYKKFVTKGYKSDKNIKILPPLFFKKDNNILFDFKNADSMKLTVLNESNNRYHYDIALVGDSILLNKSGNLDSGYNYIVVGLNDKTIQLLKNVRVTVKDSSNFTTSFSLSVIDTEETETYLERVNELVYIATPAEMNMLRNARGAKRDSLWNVFWKKRDPDPATKKNEAEIEYFERVKYANEHFSSYKPGWKTDRGMIYIKYGPPDEIESYPFNLSSEPYIIWYYNKLHKRFVFVDKYGLGDYQLVY